MTMKKIYTSAPLPFMGQKRRFLKYFKEVVITEFNDCNTFIDLFGGSGLLSHTLKTIRPDAKVVYNDYDNYIERINSIPITNVILGDIRKLLKGYPEDKILSSDLKKKVLRVIRKYEQNGFVDYITLSSSLLFSMSYVTNFIDMCKQSLYNCVRKNDYNAEGYLEGVELVHFDYKILYNIWKLDRFAVFIVDPPYLSTECSVYKNYWRLRDYLDVLCVLKNNPYIYFTSDKSSILELCEWLENNTEAQNPFADCKKRTITQKVGKNITYDDIMLFKNKFNPYLKAA